MARLTDADGQPIACKVQFIGRDGTASPQLWARQRHPRRAQRLLHRKRQFRVPLAPGKYDVIVSHGPEYDAVFTTIDVARGKETPLEAAASSAPSIRGVGSAPISTATRPPRATTRPASAGRVLNLLAEHIEFAPCTEHNRITVYDPHLKRFGAAKRMLTCPGMELTGRPLPINHQNAFPLDAASAHAGRRRPASPTRTRSCRSSGWRCGTAAPRSWCRSTIPNIPQMVRRSRHQRLARRRLRKDVQLHGRDRSPPAGQHLHQAREACPTSASKETPSSTGCN